jgi:hypothetical protein
MKRALLFGVLAALLGASPAAAHHQSFRGTVVARQSDQTLLVAGSDGAVRAFRTSSRARVGSLVVVDRARLAVVGHAKRAFVRGVFVRRAKGFDFLSAAGHMLALRGAAPATVRPGDVIATKVEIEDQDELAEDDVNEVGRIGEVRLTGTVAAVAAGSVTFTVNGQTLTIPLPAGVTIPADAVGTQVEFKVEFADAAAQAQPGDDDDDDQGEDHGDDHRGDHHGDHGDHGGDDGGGDG